MDLGNTDKFRRVLIKIRKEVSHGGIMLLQETHIMNENIIKSYWRGGYSSSCISTNSAGVMILYDNTYECLEKSNDAVGRYTSIVLENKLINNKMVKLPGCSSL